MHGLRRRRRAAHCELAEQRAMGMTSVDGMAVRGTMGRLVCVRGRLVAVVMCCTLFLTNVTRLAGATVGSTMHAQTGSHVCDVVVAGGSLASAGAAVAASEASNSTRICFLEITDWPGGQASAGGIPAMDFGFQYVNFPHNIPRSLAELLTYEKMGGPQYNPGECQYLPKCFAPEWVAEWVLVRLSAAPNVAVFLNTTIVGVDRDAAGRVVELRAVQRTPTTRHPSGWDRPLSKALPDWYSPTPSTYFDKTQLQFKVAPTGVVIEATEFGDVLVLADGVAVGQGVELGSENSTVYDEVSGNPASFSVLAEWSTGTEPPIPEVSLSSNGAARPPEWLKVRRFWTMAKHTPRSFDPYGTPDGVVPQVAPGDRYVVTSACNDLKNANVFLPLAAARATAQADTWAGGMNLTAVAIAEAQTWACYRKLNGILSALPESSGTSNGLSKMLYLRESRRSMAGVTGFRLCHNIMSANNTGPGGPGCSTGADSPSLDDNGMGYRFLDTVAIGSPQPLFGYDLHGLNWQRRLPSYIRNVVRIPKSAVPFFIPFRALTVADAPNMLVAGKSMATSFLTNSVTRLHPNEWASGVAAGVAATMMSMLNLSSAQIAANVSGLQARLRSMEVPLAFNLSDFTLA